MKNNIDTNIFFIRKFLCILMHRTIEVNPPKGAYDIYSQTSETGKYYFLFSGFFMTN